MSSRHHTHRARGEGVRQTGGETARRRESKERNAKILRLAVTMAILLHCFLSKVSSLHPSNCFNNKKRTEVDFQEERRRIQASLEAHIFQTPQSLSRKSDLIARTWPFGSSPFSLGMSKTSFWALPLISATERLVTGSVVCTIKSKTTLKMFFITAKKKRKKKRSESGPFGEAALSPHASISRGKQDQRMFSKPQPADLIIGWFPVCFPSLADTGQKHLLTKRGHRAVESGPSHFCIPSSIPCPCLTGLF